MNEGKPEFILLTATRSLLVLQSLLLYFVESFRCFALLAYPGCVHVSCISAIVPIIIGTTVAQGSTTCLLNSYFRPQNSVYK